MPKNPFEPLLFLNRWRRITARFCSQGNKSAWEYRKRSYEFQPSLRLASAFSPDAPVYGYEDTPAIAGE
jgi:hypothetical protein